MLTLQAHSLPRLHLPLFQRPVGHSWMSPGPSDCLQLYGAQPLLPKLLLSLLSCWCEWFHITPCPDFNRPLSSHVYPSIHSAGTHGEHLLPWKLSNSTFSQSPRPVFPKVYSFSAFVKPSFLSHSQCQHSNPVVQNIFVEYLLCARNCFGYWRYNDMQEELVSTLNELTN